MSDVDQYSLAVDIEDNHGGFVNWRPVASTLNRERIRLYNSIKELNQKIVGLESKLDVEKKISKDLQTTLDEMRNSEKDGPTDAGPAE